MIMRYLIPLGLLLGATPITAFAQADSDPTPTGTPTPALARPPANAPVAVQDALDLRDVKAPAGRDDFLGEGLDFNVDVSDDQSSVSVQFGQASIPSDSSLSTNWQIKLTTPITGIDNLKPGSQIDLLSDGTKLTFSFSFLSFGGTADSFTSGRFQAEIWPATIQKCMEKRGEGGANDEEARYNCEYYTAGSEKDKLRVPTSQFATTYLDENVINRVLYGDIWRGGLEGSVGFDKFEYVDPATLAKMDPNKTQASGSAFLSWYPAGRTSVLNLRAEYQNGFEAQKEQAVCKPVVIDPAVDCVTGSLMPKHVERANLSVEYRQLFDVNSELGSFAISPKATYDTLSSEFEAVFPIYFIPAKAGPFSPGFEVKYSSKTDEVTTGFFVRSTFKF